MKTKVTTFIIMLIFWTIMSGMFDAFHYSLGILSCALVAFFSSDLLFPDEGKPWIKELFGMICYLPYLMWQIILANLQVTYIVLHPRMLEKIDPHLFRFETSLKRPISKVAMAQSITLTPGTITVNIHDNQIAVYALTKEAAAGLPGEMERQVAKALEID
ncbi:MAG: Na+/H+ antiporter subunit E [Desulfuromonadales bacterium]|nr:Na+/H+ antiporter subunit E [Desulfuromonadales bacterium]MBN2793257.1 Na+/H+ antiporter subunit E [Desulfuromonadales bacterium]